ncbi:pilus assembly protein [Fulvimarina endophytica]|uniref:Pilus assembly protein n=1 Tax=Fulvimarina endophytica TaxID=2293836 RepID=A0A371X004_9HYPH|nr:TadE/TadG family type IV pilus assembly protein [Fulvimarina endophytica]RFC62573.1 pilus assembly protein [Fulvimarina endophytica]
MTYRQALSGARSRFEFPPVIAAFESARRLFQARSGAAAVEFALILPVIVLIVFGAAYLGIYLATAHSLQQLSANGSRYALVGLDSVERQALAGDAVRMAARDDPLIRPEQLMIAVTESGDWLTVSVGYDLSNSPLPSLLSNSLGSLGSIERSATVLLP